MYLPAHFDEKRPEVLQALMRARPLAAIVTHGAGGLAANHVPLMFLPGGAAGLGVLRGHVARANAMWQQAQEDAQVLAIFQGSDSYISPSWYPTKKEHGKVVPTWNYCTVHVHGTMRAHHDAQWLRQLLGSLTDAHESAMPQPWSIDDAPKDYLQALLAQIVGIEIEITHIEGKWKVSQNQPERNRAGAAKGLLARASGEDAAMAQLIAEHAPKSGL